MRPYVNVVIVGGISGNVVGCLGARYTSTTSSVDCGTAGAAGGITTRSHSRHLKGSDDTGLEKDCHTASSAGSQGGSGKGSQTGSHSGVPDGCSCRISAADLHSRRISKARACASLRCSAVISMFANCSAYVRVGFNGVDMVQSSLVDFSISNHRFQFFYFKLDIKNCSLA